MQDFFSVHCSLNFWTQKWVTQQVMPWKSIAGFKKIQQLYIFL